MTQSVVLTRLCRVVRRRQKPAADPRDAESAAAAAQPAARRPQPNAGCRLRELTASETTVRAPGRGASGTELPNLDAASQTAGSGFRRAMHPAAVRPLWPARRVASPTVVTDCHHAILPGLPAEALPAEAAPEPPGCGIPIAEAGCHLIAGLAAALIQLAPAAAPIRHATVRAVLSGAAPVRRNSGHPNSAGGHSVPSSVRCRPGAHGPENAAPSGPHKPAKPKALARWQW
jgi:hypothetical protein